VSHNETMIATTDNEAINSLATLLKYTHSTTERNEMNKKALLWPLRNG
jgi:hypothetical protein